MSSGAGAGSGKKILGAGAAPKQAGSETLQNAWGTHNAMKRSNFLSRLL